jgi:hypothetical protein
MSESLFNGEAVETIDSQADHVYLASGDDIHDVEDSIDQLQERDQIRTGQTLVTVVGGLAGLNFVPVLAPQSVVFFDTNPHSISFARLIVWLIQNTEDRLTFLSRYCSRPIRMEPTPENEREILGQPGDAALSHEVECALPEELRGAYRHYLGALRDARPAMVTLRHGSRPVLHCPDFPNSRFVSLCGRQEGGESHAIQSLHVGHGWLRNDETYRETRRLMREATIEYRTSSLGALPEDDLFEADTTYLYASNINGHCPTEWVEALINWKLHALSMPPKQHALIAITAFDGSLDVGRDSLLHTACHRSSRYAMREMWQGPHHQALRRMSSLLRGSRVCEVTHTVPYGFHELSRTNLSIEQYLSDHQVYDTVIIHTLLAAGTPASAVLQATRKARAYGARVIVFGHNPNCSDFEGGHAYIEGGTTRGGWWTREEALQRLSIAAGSTAHALHSLSTYTGGHESEDRNWVIVLDGVPIREPSAVAQAGRTDCAESDDTDRHHAMVKNILVQIGLRWLTAGELDKAVLAFVEGRRLRPNDPEAAGLCAIAWHRAGEQDRAEEILRELANNTDASSPVLDAVRQAIGVDEPAAHAA